MRYIETKNDVLKDLETDFNNKSPEHKLNTNFSLENNDSMNNSNLNIDVVHKQSNPKETHNSNS